MAGKVGYECVLTLGGNTVGKAQDVEPELTSDEIDSSTRDGNGWSSAEHGLRTLAATLKQLWVPTDDAVEAVVAAFVGGTELACELKDDAGNGWSCNVKVFNLSWPQALSGSVTLSCRIRNEGAVTRLSGSS